MKTDPILREVYRMKDQLAREVGYDVDKLFDMLREEAKKHPERMVNLASKPDTRAKRRTANRKTGK